MTDKIIFSKDIVELAKAKDLKIWVIGTSDENFNPDQEQLFANVNILNYPEIYKPFITSYNYPEDNINYLYKILNEFVAMYYVWKNKPSKYVAFCHYRRLIPIDIINFNELDRGKIQYFSCHYNIEYQTHYCKEECINKKYSHLYEFIFQFLCNANNMYDDLEKYLDEQNILNQKDMMKYNDITHYTVFSHYITREMYACKWEEFDKLMKFIYGYVNFIENEYSLKNITDWKKYISTEIIDKLLNTVKTSCPDNLKLFNFFDICNIKTINQLSSDDKGYGFINIRIWRAYAYLIEELIGMYISVSSNYHSTLLENPIMMEVNNSWCLLFKKIKNEKPKNLLIFTNELQTVKLMNLYKSIYPDANIYFFNIYSDFYDEVLNNVRDKQGINVNYLKNFYESNKVYNLNDNSYDYIIIDNNQELNNDVQNQLAEVINNKCILVDYDNNKYNELFNKLQMNYDIHTNMIPTGFRLYINKFNIKKEKF